MKRHVIIYRKYWGYSVSPISQEEVPCDWCQKLNTEVHHIQKRQAGGSRKRDIPSNLVALCRGCHTMADHNKEFNAMVKKKLEEKIRRRNGR